MKLNELQDQLEKYQFISLDKFLKKFAGKFINSGVSRNVYEFKLSKRYVLKIEKNRPYYDNVMEFKIWTEARYYSDIHKFLAPTVWISKSCKIILQRKIKISPIGKNYPLKMPNIFTDLKYTNYGFINKRIVCCDYSRCLLFNGMRSRNVKWWSEDTVNIKDKQ